MKERRREENPGAERIQGEKIDSLGLLNNNHRQENVEAAVEEMRPHGDSECLQWTDSSRHLFKSYIYKTRLWNNGRRDVLLVLLQEKL